VLTWRQCSYWKNGITLFARTVEVTSNNAVAHLNLGNALFRSGRREESILHYYEALRIAPDFPAAHGNLGRVLADTGRHREALHHLRRYVTLNPRAGDISFTLMLIKVVEGRLAGGR
jgi:tetratricopeptide (TPR) repeat protein